VAATNRDLEREAAAGRFREDLFQRLKVVTIELPPLRERTGDIPKLTQRLLQRIATRVGKKTTRVSAELLSHLQALPWPGNVRELENALTRAVVLAPGEILLPEHFPPPEATLAAAEQKPVEGRRGVQTLAEVEKEAILRALEAAEGHKGRACDLLGISRPTLERKLERHGLSMPGRPARTPMAPIRIAEG
ncbi:MAG TPA: helix-turn-helix domain-containing protein, partial [Vulgatibacter sp.]